MIPALLLALAASTETSTGAPRIELITIGPGSYLYSYWGHAALRVIDPLDGSDRAYNFGGIDLEGGVLGMLRGYVRGYMFETRFSELLAQYSGEDRTITRRPLRLPEEARRRLAARLRQAAQGERRYYAYHHFQDNCSTRIADELDLALEGRLRAAAQAPTRGTHRARVLRPVRHAPWLYALLDLSYGPVVDRPLSAWDTGFLVDGFAALVDGARLDGAPLAEGAFDVYRSISGREGERWAWPWILMYSAIFGPLALLSAFFPRVGQAFTGLLFGALGLTFALLWLLSSYDFFAWNPNLLVFPATHLALPFLPAALRRRYLFAHSGLLVALLAASAWVGTPLLPFLAAALPASLVLTGHAQGKYGRRSADVAPTLHHPTSTAG